MNYNTNILQDKKEYNGYDFIQWKVKWFDIYGFKYI